MEEKRHREGARPGALDAAANNADLWTVYLRAQVRSWLDPFGLAPPQAVDVIARPIADAAAGAVASWMTALAAPTVRAMYEGNRPDVDGFLRERPGEPDGTRVPDDYVCREAPDAAEAAAHQAAAHEAALEAAHTQTEEWWLVTRREPALVG
jgi:hypothetical protein